MKDSSYTISAVERDVGLSKDVLRVWERRYGFPSPLRDQHGERLYSADQVRRLRLVKRLIDSGHRPGNLLTMPSEDLNALAEKAQDVDPGNRERAGPAQDVDELLALLQRHEVDAFAQALRQRLAASGLAAFVHGAAVPLAQTVGRAWAGGRLHAFEEHLFTELTARTLRQAIAALPVGRGPRVMLTTLAGEQHGLALLMLEAVLALEGARCVPLGVQLPTAEIAQAAQAHKADVVAISLSASFPARQVGPALSQLRLALPEHVALWAGGAGLRRTRVEGVAVMHSLHDAVAALSAAPP